MTSCSRSSRHAATPTRHTALDRRPPPLHPLAQALERITNLEATVREQGQRIAEVERLTQSPGLNDSLSLMTVDNFTQVVVRIVPGDQPERVKAGIMTRLEPPTRTHFCVDYASGEINPLWSPPRSP